MDVSGSSYGSWSRTSCGIAKRRRHSASTLSGKRFVNSMPWPIQLFALNDISFCVPALVARGGSVLGGFIAMPRKSCESRG